MSHQNRSLHEISNNEPGEPICRECQDYVHGYCSIHGLLVVVPNIKKEDNSQSDSPQMRFVVKDEAEACGSDTAFQNDNISMNPIAVSSEASEKNPDEKLANFLAILEQCTSSLNVTEDVKLLDGNGDFELSELVLNSENLAEKDSNIKRIQAQLDEEIMRDIKAEAKIFQAFQINNTFRENLCKELSKELVKNNPQTSKPVMNTNIAKFKCDECGKEFCTKDILTNHSMTFKTNQKHSIETHLKMHSIRKGLSCDICEYRCARKNDLKLHMRTHTGEKPFSCNICEYRCTVKSTLKHHIRTHTGEKPFTCNICEYRCSQKSNLKAHMRTHTREKPFCCNICEFRFTQKSHLNDHMRTHTGEKPFTCNICEFRCSKKSTLKKHIRTHTGEKPFTCNICEFRCSHKSALNNHIKTHR